MSPKVSPKVSEEVSPIVAADVVEQVPTMEFPGSENMEKAGICSITSMV